MERWLQTFDTGNPVNSQTHSTSCDILPPSFLELFLEVVWQNGSAGARRERNAPWRSRRERTGITAILVWFVAFSTGPPGSIALVKP